MSTIKFSSFFTDSCLVNYKVFEIKNIILLRPDMVVHTCYPSYSSGNGSRIKSLRPTQTKLARPYLKNKRARGMAQIIECLPSHAQDLGLNAQPHKIINK
jgi:hypothetical protein